MKYIGKLGPDQVAAIGNGRKDRRRPEPVQVKIREGVYVIQNMLKTPGGLIHITAVDADGRLRDVQISSDFFFYLAEGLLALECVLEGVQVETVTVTGAAVQFYARQSVDSPGVRL